MKRRFGLIALCLAFMSDALAAAPFGAGWEIERTASSLSFTSQTVGAAPETGFLKLLEGSMTPDGSFAVSIPLDAVETGDLLRDARLRFLLFETFRLPAAEVTAQLEPDALAGLIPGGRKRVTIPMTLKLNEVSRAMTAQLDVVMIADDIVSVATAEPILLALDDFGYLPGLAKLGQAAGVEILPKTEVRFEVLFKAISAAAQTPDPAALAACGRRIQTIAQSDQVYFTSGSSQLETKSFPLLDGIVDTMQTCPTLDLRIEGHTDNVGPQSFNLGLSIRRAAEVVTYLTVKGVDPVRISATGFGEERPIADNTTRRGRWKNRRIEFIVPGS